MANFHRRRNVPEPAQKMCIKHPNVPAMRGRKVCFNCATFEDQAKRERKRG